MLSYITSIIKRFRPTSSYQSLNTISISKSRISQNLHLLQKLQPKHTLIPVVKSNAYGHGLKQICNILKIIKDINIPLIAVDSYPEYQVVADIINTKVLVLGETLTKNYRLYDVHRTHLAIGTIQALQALINTKNKWDIHLFLNTGMNREGFQKDTLLQALELLQKNTHIRVVGVMSHLANADINENKCTDQQIQLFKRFYQTIIEYGHTPSYVHIANSAGISKIDDPLFNASRTGLAMYGYNPLGSDDPYYSSYTGLQPTLRLTSTITSLQHIDLGAGVSYGLTRTTDKSTTLATLPIGYNEGLPRMTGAGYYIYYKDKPLPLRGKICMNLCSCDIGDLSLQVGEQIEIIGRDEEKDNTIIRLSQIENTIPYVTLTNLNSSIKRIIVE